MGKLLRIFLAWHLVFSSCIALAVAKSASHVKTTEAAPLATSVEADSADIPQVTLNATVMAEQTPADDEAMFLQQIFLTIQGMGGLSAYLKLSALITLIVSSMKVSVIRQKIWDKLGPAKAWVAPALGLAAGVLGLGAGGAPLTLASAVAYVSAGAGAILLHELLDSVKEVPGVGKAYGRVIDAAKKSLGGQASSR